MKPAYWPQANFALTAEQKADARHAIAALAGSGLTLAQAAQLALVGRAPVERRTVAEAVTAFAESRRTKGLRNASLDWYSTRLQALVDRAGKLEIGNLKRKDLERIAAAIASDAGGMAELTRASYYRCWRALWRWSLAQDPACVSADITAGLPVTARREESSGAEFLPVATVAAAMAGIAPRFRSAAALLFFAGIRPQEIWGHGKEPLRWEHVLAGERIIRIPASAAKTRRARIIEGLPENIWAWMKPGKRDEPICPAQSQYLVRHIQEAAGFAARPKGRNEARKMLKPWPHDATRHSFATYALALTSDAGKVALWLGHEGRPTMLFNHYRGLTTQAEAQAYFAIRPESR